MGQLGLSKANGPGTTPEDLQTIFAAEYVNSHTNPVIKGGETTGRGDLRYNYAAGVGLVKTASGAVKVTWAAGTTALVTQPSVARTDVIYVTLNGLVQVGAQGSVNESTVCVIDKRTLPAGATATSASTRAVDRNYALHYGSQLGWLSMHVETNSQGSAVPKNRMTWSQQTFTVPTDRDLQLRMHQCIYGEHNAGAPSTDFSQFGMGSMKYFFYVDNILIREFELGYSRVWEVKMHNVDFKVLAGTHTVRLERQHVWGVANPLYFGASNNIWQPSSMGVHDEGVSE